MSGVFDGVFFTPQQGGPGGAAAMSYSEVGPGNVSAAAQLNDGVSQVIAAPGSARGPRLPRVLWMFVFLIVGYWGLHKSLQVV